MRFYAITVDQIVYRFYLMMAIVLIALFSGWTSFALLSLPIFLSAILGIRFRTPAPRKVIPIRQVTSSGKVVELSSANAVEGDKVA
ncbi:hypothetical protein [Neolewinella litorea]|uniref:Uncharacterized protein n=1 Tax=Neolewinella litorea TaxID=2562452 RepID=A0A4S4NKB9_9BACT|nr:hypothetical protein [Neolewinella litorea]THH40304.1 hypothetical protein E4021_06090 [Neolewinella litorea]